MSEPSASGSARRRTETPQQRAETSARSPARARSLRTGKANGRLTRAARGGALAVFAEHDGVEHPLAQHLAVGDGGGGLDRAQSRRLQCFGEGAVGRGGAGDALGGGEGAQRLLGAHGGEGGRAFKAGAEGVARELHLLDAVDAAEDAQFEAGEDAAAALFFVAGGGEVCRQHLGAGVAGHARLRLGAGDLGAEGDEPLVGDCLPLPLLFGEDGKVHLAGDVEAARPRHDAAQAHLLAVQEDVADVVRLKFLLLRKGAAAKGDARDAGGGAVAHHPLPAREAAQLRGRVQVDLRRDDGGEHERAALGARFHLFDAQAHLRLLGGRGVLAGGAVRKLRPPLHPRHRAVGRGGDGGKEELAAVAHLPRQHLGYAAHDARAGGEQLFVGAAVQAALDDGLRAQAGAAGGVFVCFVLRTDGHGRTSRSFSLSSYAADPAFMPRPCRYSLAAAPLLVPLPPAGEGRPSAPASAGAPPAAPPKPPAPCAALLLFLKKKTARLPAARA